MNTQVWQPQHPERTQMWTFMRYAEQVHHHHFDDYQALHYWSIKHPDLFWSTLCDFFQIHFKTPAKQPLNHYRHMLEARWFEGATFNFAEKLLSRDDEHPALICINEPGLRHVYSYHELRQQVAQCAAGLKYAGVKCGDRVAAMLPNTSYTIIAMLATTSLGAIWASCSPDFGLDAAVDRFGQIEPHILLLCDGYQYQDKRFNTLDKMKDIHQQIPSLSQIVVCPFLGIESTLQHPFIHWQDFLKPATSLEFTALPFDHPIYIMFSSGTTGAPKCIVHGAGGTLLQHFKELGLHTDLKANDNLFFYTTCGWMMWNWMVSALALGTTLTLYDGAPMHPEPTRLFQLIDEEGVTVFGTSAKYLSAVEKSGANPKSQLKMSSLRCILSTGSPLLPKNYDFVYQSIKPDVQLCSISGGTDIISCFALGNPLLPIYRGELQCLGLGMNVAIWDENGSPLMEQPGELVCTTPFPSMPIFFWNDPDNKRYQHAYFDKYPSIWAHGDRAEITSHLGLIIYGRSDAVLNPGGVRIGTAEIYHQIEKIADIMDSVVIAQSWQDDVRIVLFVKLRNGLTLDETLRRNIRELIRTHASPKHVPAKILQVPDIPRTINGKIVELAVRDVVEGRAVTNKGSIANPESLNFFMNRSELAEN